jgi:hypothetical protein
LRELRGFRSQDERRRCVRRGEQPPDLAYTIGHGHKIVVDAKTKSWRLYSLLEDPAERVDLASSQKETARLLLEKHISGARRLMSAEVIERLRSLGYTATSK